MRSWVPSPRPNTSIGTSLVENGSPWRPSDNEEDDQRRGGRRRRGRMVVGVRTSIRRVARDDGRACGTLEWPGGDGAH
jgi:hypothetical protein